MENKFFRTSPEYITWSGMLSRCFSPKNKDYPRYGGRGIDVCSRWRHSFENFCGDMGHRPDGKTLDRIDVNGDYSADNCRWATPKEQGRNRRNNVVYTINGKTQNLSAWAEETGIKRSTIQARINKYGMTLEEAIEPVEYNSLTYNGVTKTLLEWADDLGCGLTTLMQRISCGDSVERVLRPVRKAATFTFSGKTQSIAQWSKETGIKRYLLSERLHRLGWSIEEALTRPVEKKGNDSSEYKKRRSEAAIKRHSK